MMPPPILPPAWSNLLEQMEAALSRALTQTEDLARLPPLTDFALALDPPAERVDGGSAPKAASISAAAADVELARAEERLRIWLAAGKATGETLEPIPVAGLK